jgi:glycosyltransferase involved in cell wall biosynthesis
LWFEQRHLPQIAQEAEVELVFIMGRAAPLRSPVPVVVELTPKSPQQLGSTWERLRRAMAEAGAAGATLRYAWSDLDFGSERIEPARRLAPFVDPAFRVTEEPTDSKIQMELGLPPAYVLSHGPYPHTVHWLLAAWSWVDASVGDQIPLVLAGLSAGAKLKAQQEMKRLNLEESVHLLSSLEWHQLPALYRGAQAFLHGGSSQTGQEFRWALASGVPIASVEGSLAASIAGEAAYLAPAGDTRALGAACLTLLVEPEVAKPLRQKGLLRAGAYHGEGPRDAWCQALEGFARVIDTRSDR